MKTFQQPLSAEEEACCIKRMREEDGERAAQARALLIERNLRLVAHIAKKYQNLDEDMEDLISIGTIRLTPQRKYGFPVMRASVLKMSS